MRQIKFRAWDTVLKRWNLSVEIDCFGRVQEYKYNGSAFYQKYYSDYECSTELEDANKRFILMQFTGLYDCEGTPIYEGDIVTSTWGYSGVVEFNKFIYAEMECTISDDIKVIGNIYEHQTLKQ